MAVFGVEVRETEELKWFLKEINKKIKVNDMVKNPFFIKIKRFVSRDRVFLIFKIDPIWPNFSFIGYPILIVWWMIIQRFSFFFLIPLAICFSGVFWTSYFFYLSCRLGLMKAGYKGYIKRLGSKDIIGLCVFGDGVKWGS